MNKCNFYRKLKELKLVAHRLGFLMTDYPENSLEVLEIIFEDNEKLESCSGFEFDICFTKDHVPVVIHDKYIDDISNSSGMVSSFNIDELQKVNFGFRKSLVNNTDVKFKIITLEQILHFFSSNLVLLKDKIIKIETKDGVLFNNYNMMVLADIIDKFPELASNIIHLSFYPTNLISLKKIQKKKDYNIVKSDLLCDYKVLAKLFGFMKSIDFISLRIKTRCFPKLSSQNSVRVNRKIFFDTLFMKFSNAIDEKTLKHIIDNHGSVGLYVLNDENDINDFCKRISDKFFEEYYDKFIFTTDNPIYLKSKFKL